MRFHRQDEPLDYRPAKGATQILILCLSADLDTCFVIGFLGMRI